MQLQLDLHWENEVRNICWYVNDKIETTHNVYDLNEQILNNVTYNKTIVSS